MKNAIIFCAMLLTASMVWLSCGENNPVSHEIDYYVEETFSFTVDVQDQSSFRLVGITGTIEVTGQTGVEAITIAGERRVGASSTSEARAHLEDLQVEVQDTESEVFVRTIQLGDAEGRSYVVDYTITLPPDLEVWVSNQTGTVTVEKMDNIVRANVVTGGVILGRIDGDAHIDVTTGQVSLHQVSGNINADLTTGQLSFDQVSGNINADLTTGNIICQAFLPPGGVIDLKVVTGSMTVRIPESTSAQFSASVSTGTIEISDLPLQNQNITNNSVSGQLGDGNGTITLRAVTGNVIVLGFVD